MGSASFEHLAGQTLWPVIVPNFGASDTGYPELFFRLPIRQAHTYQTRVIFGNPIASAG